MSAGGGAGAMDASRAEAVASRQAEVESALRGGNLEAAVKAALQNPPVNSKDPTVKVSPPGPRCNLGARVQPVAGPRVPRAPIATLRRWL